MSATAAGGRYRGPDRRVLGSPGGPDRTLWCAWTFVVAAVAVIMGPALGPLTSASAPAAVAALHGAAGLLAAGLAASGVLYWRATGRVRGIWVTAAAAVLPLAAVAEFSFPGDPSPAAAAVSAIAGAHLVAAIASPEIDTGTTPRRVLVRAVAAALGAGLLGAAASGIGADAIIVMSASVWGAAAVIGTVLAWRGASAYVGWIAAAAVPVALGELPDLAALAAVFPGAVAPLLHGTGLAIAAIGGAVAMSRSVAEHRDGILDRELLYRAQEESRRLATEDRNHDLGNALMAIEGATLAMARLRERLTEEQQDELAQAVVRSAAEVRRLTGSELEDLTSAASDVRAVVQQQATMARANGVAVEVVEVVGRDAVPVKMPSAEVQQVLQNLLVNAQRHGGADADHPVAILIDRRGDEIVVEVVDEGPGVPPDAWERIFERRARLSASGPGEGLGLHVARRLVRAHGGDLALAPSERGARFVLHLPAAQSLTSV